MVKAYYLLTKPGILIGNIITAIGGFFLVSKGDINPWLLFATLLGLACVMASGCVFNNYLDRVADEKMERTKDRALAKGEISIRSALVFAVMLGLAGAFVLSVSTNLLTLSIALGGFFVYVVLYTIWKYKTTHATLIGSIAGAAPPVVGYCAVSNCFDTGAFLLFLVLVLWQMPHFFSIAIFRQEEYAAASIPVLPIKRGMHATKVQMVLYIVAFMGACALLTFFGYVGYLFLAMALVLGAAWLYLCVQGFKSSNDKLWARKMFRFSLVVITFLSIMICVN